MIIKNNSWEFALVISSITTLFVFVKTEFKLGNLRLEYTFKNFAFLEFIIMRFSLARSVVLCRSLVRLSFIPLITEPRIMRVQSSAKQKRMRAPDGSRYIVNEKQE